jgi:hypothetical protein
MAAGKYRAFNSGKIFVGKHTSNLQFRRECDPVRNEMNLRVPLRRGET